MGLSRGSPGSWPPRVWLGERGDLANIVARWQGLRTVVLGDSFVDEWWYGDPERLSREAPVPVVSLDRVQRAPGGAANTAVNLAALGAHPVLVTGVSDDADVRMRPKPDAQPFEHVRREIEGDPLCAGPRVQDELKQPAIAGPKIQNATDGRRKLLHERRFARDTMRYAFGAFEVRGRMVGALPFTHRTF